MLSQQVKDTAIKIGEFYLNKHQGDLAKAHREIRDLQVTDLIVFKNMVIIKTCRPGLLIGPKGNNISNLATSLGKHVHIIEDENELEGWLLPCENDYDDYDYEGVTSNA